MCQRTSGERGSSREVDGKGDRVRLNVLYHFPLPLSFGHSDSGTQTVIILTVFLILFFVPRLIWDDKKMFLLMFLDICHYCSNELPGIVAEAQSSAPASFQKACKDTEFFQSALWDSTEAIDDIPPAATTPETTLQLAVYCLHLL